MSNKNETAIEFCERTQPQATDEFKRLFNEMYELFCKKQKDYGAGNISLGTRLETEDERRLALTGLFFRKNDKVQRLKQLVALNQKGEVESESVEDTYMDLAIYAIISLIVLNDKWGK